MDCTNTTELELRLAEAKTAYHKLMLGQSPRVFVDQNGERVEYTAANAARLTAYIRGLEQQINACKGRQFGRPMGVYL